MYPLWFNMPYPVGARPVDTHSKAMDFTSEKLELVRNIDRGGFVHTYHGYIAAFVALGASVTEAEAFAKQIREQKDESIKSLTVKIREAEKQLDDVEFRIRNAKLKISPSQQLRDVTDQICKAISGVKADRRWQIILNLLAKVTDIGATQAAFEEVSEAKPKAASPSVADQGECACKENKDIPGILFPTGWDTLGDSEDGKVFITRCDACALFKSDEAAAKFVSALAHWQVEYTSDEYGQKPYFKVTLLEAENFVKRVRGD